MLPGIGIAIGDNVFSGGLPESIARVATSGSDLSLLRNNYQTLLFGDNRMPVRFISWNVQRFTEFDKTLGAPRDISDATPLSSIAQVVAPFDVIAMQELWSTSEANALLTAINARRTTLGLGPVQMFGPVEFPPSALLPLVLSDPMIDADLHGGLFIYSKFPAIAQNYAVYNDCRDADCLKAKGVQWVRLSLATPAALAQTPTCLSPITGTGTSCPRQPSSDEFIDVFNTHMQADDSKLCVPFGGGFTIDPVRLAEIRTGVTGGMFDVINTATMRCLLSPASVRGLQLAQMGTFIKDMTADATDRSSIIMGDFNLDGRPTAGGTFGTEYTGMLGALGIRPISPGTPPEVHEIKAFPTDFAWDIDQADIARTTTGTGDVNTSIVPTDGENALNPAPELTPWNLGPRLDYILVRPGVPLGTSPPIQQNYVIGLGNGAGVPTRMGCSSTHAWCGWFPGIVDRDPAAFASGVPEQFSDHKPLIGNLMVVSLREPPPYHPDFRHDYSFRIRTYDATGESDCAPIVSCNPVDPLVELKGARQPVGGALATFVGPFNSTVCSGQWKGARVGSACMANWQTTFSNVRSSTTFRMRSQARMLEDDLGPTDIVPTMSPGDHPLMDVVLGTGAVVVRNHAFSPTVPTGWTDQLLRNSDPIDWCTRDRPALMCIQTRLDEVDP